MPARINTIHCPKCGTENPAKTMNCKNCRINLEFALANPDALKATDQEPVQVQDLPPSKGDRHLAIIVIIPLLTLVGCQVGLVASQYLNSSRAVKWEILVSPPEKAVKLLAADVDFIYIQSETGKVYYYDIVKNFDEGNYYDLVNNRGQWQETAASSARSRSNPKDFRHTAYPDPPGKVIETVYAEISSAEFIREARFALTDDGHVEMWRFTPTMFPDPHGFILGSLAGFLCGVLLLYIMFHIQH